ncbi:ATP phosphoribosyltransferase regulatory subunit, partial [Porticoccus sp.]
ALQESYPEADLYLDLSELRGYHYHTGIVFAAYAQGVGQAIGNGGRYDHVGEEFGRSRPATGFNMSLQALAQLSNGQQIAAGIFAPVVENSAQRQVIAELRAAGERVVCGFPGQQPDYEELHCDRQLLLLDGTYQIKPV